MADFRAKTGFCLKAKKSTSRNYKTSNYKPSCTAILCLKKLQKNTCVYYALTCLISHSGCRLKILHKGELLERVALRISDAVCPCLKMPHNLIFSSGLIFSRMDACLKTLFSRENWHSIRVYMELLHMLKPAQYISLNVFQKTLEDPDYEMLATTEHVQLMANLIRLMKAKKAIEIGKKNHSIFFWQWLDDDKLKMTALRVC